MYKLTIHFPAPEARRPELVRVGTAAEVLGLIPVLLEQHEGCARIEVTMDELRLFAVDCRGGRIEPEAA